MKRTWSPKRTHDGLIAVGRRLSYSGKVAQFLVNRASSLASEVSPEAGALPTEAGSAASFAALTNPFCPVRRWRSAVAGRFEGGVCS